MALAFLTFGFKQKDYYVGKDVNLRSVKEARNFLDSINGTPPSGYAPINCGNDDRRVIGKIIRTAVENYEKGNEIDESHCV